MFRSRRRHQQQEQTEFVHRLAEVSAEIDLRDDTVIDLRDRSAALRKAIDAEARTKEHAAEFARGVSRSSLV